MIESGLIQALLAEQSVSSLVGTNITPAILPEDSPMPALTVTVITGMSKPTLDTTGWQKWRLQFDGWGKTYSDACNVRDAVMAFLTNKQLTLNGTVVTFILIGPNNVPPYAGVDELFRCSFDMYAIFTLPA